ncbi:alpha-1,3-galactosidase B [uncultured Muribaculum sp.]|uniref:alpha-1,3-galactosidase B n=1 Tax=uncultured Muribaculum sp. TaxID=1918613 RepID=UPI00260C9168|nr:alpha-1,3-galactosidase B [uncultured Muribaculum sp.]
MAAIPASAETIMYDASDYGIRPGSGKDAAPLFRNMLRKVKEKHTDTTGHIVVRLDKGVYEFHPSAQTGKEYYISNHDQDQPKMTGINIDGWKNLTIEGNGATLLFHGRMLPIALVNSSGCTLKNFSIDFANPQIAQVQVVSNSPDEGITFKPTPWVIYRISPDSVFETYGEGWTARPFTGIAFEESTRRVLYNSGDLSIPTKGVRRLTDGNLLAPQWNDPRLTPGTVVAMRTWHRPTPGIFLHRDTATTVSNVKVHYAEGMGLLAQLCTDITLDRFDVCLKGDSDPRYFTTQADATHFSQCKGTISSSGGLYEGMMDDAINVHGIYLVVKELKDENTVIAGYGHEQAWGFKWGEPGDSVMFIRSATMEIAGEPNFIESIRPVDTPTEHGMREMEIRFKFPVDKAVDPAAGKFGIENLSWTPEVRFAHNTIRNNRARGTLFSTPRHTVVEDNIFDHTSGTAILLCGDCNGWYETGACRDIIIRRNKFVNALTTLYQFTNAVISIYPEIPDLQSQRACFHGGTPGAITIVDNEFDTFDSPILYAKSVDGLVFKNNVIRTNSEYTPFHWNRNRFLFEHVTNVEISE